MTANDEDAEAGSSELSAKDLKKLRSKQRRAEKKAQEIKKGMIKFLVGCCVASVVMDLSPWDSDAIRNYLQFPVIS